ncbi:cobyric acid synthase [Halorubellus sp. JP-L1]|uniref:cobyric acid synthase n=1 Tax=Halorubellus sp. JP-L1 TaxID=2715753 RepID=UPI0014095CD9|nr:cobyric acid synthase [Halorubellus sp. JP-L1]NHN43199.1 cobyric acid synthase [Halorubellus sp. JP-L1]
MTETILVAGTASHVGKSTVVAGLCRRLANRGVDVAPFKAQNMSNNAHVAVTPAGVWGEIGVSQHAQARAARVPPSTDHNPVLLKPRGDGESQVVVDGDPIGHFAAGEYYDEHWTTAREAAQRAHDRLADAHDVVVAEGAGSIAEINLHDRDLANVETARFADASVVVVGDVERGGVFASLYGTLELMPEDVRDRVVGLVVSKFRGDRSILDPGIEELEARTGVPVLGVLPHDDPGLPEEDSLGIPDDDGDEPFPVDGEHDGVQASQTVTVGVVRLPRVSNVTDFEPLAATPGVRVAYLDPETAADGGLDAVDALALPGTKNTVDDLAALRDAGFEDALAAFDGPVLGVCGGYQMLGERIANATVEGTDAPNELPGFGRLPVETRFSTSKRVDSVTVPFDGGGFLHPDSRSRTDAHPTASGYEIHMGTTTVEDDVPRPLGPASAATDSTVGTYLHGLFENDAVREAFVTAVYDHAGRPRPEQDDRRHHDPFDDAADLVAPLDPLAADADWLPDITESPRGPR